MVRLDFTDALLGKGDLARESVRLILVRVELQLFLLLLLVLHRIRLDAHLEQIVASFAIAATVRAIKRLGRPLLGLLLCFGREQFHLRQRLAIGELLGCVVGRADVRLHDVVQVVRVVLQLVERPVQEVLEARDAVLIVDSTMGY